MHYTHRTYVQQIVSHNHRRLNNAFSIASKSLRWFWRQSLWFGMQGLYHLHYVKPGGRVQWQQLQTVKAQIALPGCQVYMIQCIRAIEKPKRDRKGHHYSDKNLTQLKKLDPFVCFI